MTSVTVGSSVVQPPEALDRRGLGVLFAGHAVADGCQSAVPALLPFLIAEHGWSYAHATLLLLAVTVTSSVVQPLFGLASDRWSVDWLMVAGLVTAGAGIGVTAVASDHAMALLAAAAAGVGVAAFHPEGSRYAGYVSGARRASGMSVFALGGNVGFALGPLIVTPLLLLFGRQGALLMMVPAAIVAAVLAAELSRLRTFRSAARGSRHASRENRWGPFARLCVVIVTRSIAFFGLLTFVPLYYVGVLDASKATANIALAILLAGGAAGTVVGGVAADRFGRRPVLVVTLGAAPALIALFLSASPPVAIAILAAVGAAVICTFSVTVVLGQELLPGRMGLASGVTLGLPIGIGGLAVPALGVVADDAGLTTALWIVCALPLLGAAAALTLPDERPRGEVGGDLR